MFNRRSLVAGGLAMAAAPSLAPLAQAQAARPLLIFAGDQTSEECKKWKATWEPIFAGTPAYKKVDYRVVYPATNALLLKQESWPADTRWVLDTFLASEDGCGGLFSASYPPGERKNSSRRPLGPGWGGYFWPPNNFYGKKEGVASGVVFRRHPWPTICSTGSSRAYASVHRDWRNKATHFVGIPIIVFSLLLILSLWRFELGGREWTMSLAVAIVAVLGWMALDLGLGIVMALIMVVAWYAAEALAGAAGLDFDRVDGLHRAVRRRLGAAVPRPSLRRQAAGAARQHLPGLHRADVPGRRSHGGHGPAPRSRRCHGRG